MSMKYVYTMSYLIHMSGTSNIGWRTERHSLYSVFLFRPSVSGAAIIGGTGGTRPPNILVDPDPLTLNINIETSALPWTPLGAPLPDPRTPTI